MRGDHVVDLGLRLGRGHLAACTWLSTCSALLGWGARVKALPAPGGSRCLQQGALDVVGVATQLALLDVAVGTGRIGAAGLLDACTDWLAGIRAPPPYMPWLWLPFGCCGRSSGRCAGRHRPRSIPTRAGRRPDRSRRSWAAGLAPARCCPRPAWWPRPRPGRVEVVLRCMVCSGHSALAGLSDFFLVLPFDRAFLHVKHLQRELVDTSLVVLFCLTMLVSSPSSWYLARSSGRPWRWCSACTGRSGSGAAVRPRLAAFR